jgi:hypothetical protein
MTTTKKYLVTYTQTAYWTMEIPATNEDKAIEKAQKIYKDDTSKMEWGAITETFYQSEGEI